ncbi:hypothetical protein [Sphaerobacter sp.]|uniref:hypothetical protein n=1 Tax=Sphaerobacter sp. TaxID=2099654 RepID=UPI001D5E68B7|nr:hypothetical protein [Sphaerobacter sp.]MBX5444346.1 hypothetical protein [Sphaerobacter sp.]
MSSEKSPESERANHPPLYVWLDADPRVEPPDTEIEDVPGVPDLELLVAAILEGRFGSLLPARIAVSPHRTPTSPNALRRIDVGRLLRDRGIPHRQRFEILRRPAEAES